MPRSYDEDSEYQIAWSREWIVVMKRMPQFPEAKYGPKFQWGTLNSPKPSLMLQTILEHPIMEGDSFSIV